mmetsp:Transcript_45692/g.73680  ORF Transcript_45692/g.73680 Transcript_45692/m.73680 type:complete len:209 (+) Transcript_45692:852-1478(+)
MPKGALNRAEEPSPSAKPLSPLPATVVTAPAGETLRMVLLLKSATSNHPCLSIDTPKGCEKRAATPRPSAKPACPLPATVVTIPVRVTLRMAWLLQSATRRLASLSTARPRGILNRALRPCPSSNPCLPPARSEITPVGDTVMIAKWVHTKSVQPSLGSTAKDIASPRSVRASVDTVASIPLVLIFFLKFSSAMILFGGLLAADFFKS